MFPCHSRSSLAENKLLAYFLRAELVFFHAQHGDTPGREGSLVPSLSSAGTGLILPPAQGGMGVEGAVGFGGQCG